jgi:ATP-dependent Clp protease protease subunit
MKLESNPNNGTITARGMIGDFDNAISADDFRAVLDDHAGKDVTIHLNSEGGSVTDGLSIFNAIAQHEGEVTVHVDVLAASIATVICCAADRVVMNSNAKYMVHRCWTAAMGNCRDFRQMADTMEMLDGDIAAVYSDRTGMKPEALLTMMDAETWLTAEDAVALGFVDEVHEVRKEKPQASQPQEIKAVAPVSMSASLRAGMSRRLRMRKH